MHYVTTILLPFALNIYYYPAAAIPARRHPLDHTDADDRNPLLSPKSWIPIVIVVVILTCIALFIWSKKSLLKAFAKFGSRTRTPPANTNSTSVTRELTAEQLAGSDTVEGLPAVRQPRRNRRPRRTPSQVSVTSLPVYNKEPGEEELVIFRGRDMEDATIPSAMVAEEEDSSSSSHDRSQVSRYTLVSTNELPLLHNDPTLGDLSLSTLVSSDMRRPSNDSSLHETSSLMRVDSNLPEGSPDPRGEAPAYFEVVDLSQDPIPTVPTTQTSSVPPSTSPSHEPQQRRSGFRTFLNRMSMMSHVPEHRRAESDQSSSSNGHRPDRSPPNRTPTHRPSQSSSGSIFRTISHQRSIQTLNSSVRLNSPSLISLNSISSPLSHTLVRTEFTYPKSGPTPEQLKVISSRENFSRFGVPYGPDAIAFAASSSRQDLEPPPPDFEEASSSQISLIRPALSRRLDSSGSVVGDTRPSISVPVSEGQGEDRTTQALSVDDNQHSENVPPNNNNTSSASPPPSISKKIPDPIPPRSSSSSTAAVPSPPPTNEFGKLLTPPQDGTSRSDSRTSNYSVQSYATASEGSLAERTGHVNNDGTNATATATATATAIDSGPSVPKEDLTTG